MVAHIERLQPVIDWLACPVCARQGCWQRLTADGTSLVCPHRHTIDVARQGYATMTAGPAGVNADTAGMLDARTRVLSSGLLDPVDDLLARRLHGAQRILEVGAGTGFHLAAVLDRLGAPAQGLATDISPAAVRRAAVAHPRMS
ncbi:putative RNA methyltransferase, partial [Cutibacterium granulosum]|uniref:putative RNA methyltransferase n=1 Tax=Cutibacterium granulosum TaxID=33011 RepID=UPI002B36EA4D|nr:SAM-dependent methyltransferase [Cutibacterium granulosum]